ncbi:hypothetical protein IV203_011985 [Nitzschia inconspicua]|uniref:DUF6824 domain-containing protein n=1 Tax=Nitzschia inconspicua TaxID=303405 RepID=A0A9K3KSZ6_9STRA|nr:hypothetical protein IV203_011985 [Nitzschia inconspicua]
MAATPPRFLSFVNDERESLTIPSAHQKKQTVEQNDRRTDTQSIEVASQCFTTKTQPSYNYSQNNQHPSFSLHSEMPQPAHPYRSGFPVPPSYSFDSGGYPSYGNAVGPPPLPSFHYYMHYPPPPPIEPLEFVTDPQPSDVLSGRGGATNSHSGNRAFRSLVKKYQGQYLKAKKKDKPAVAAEVVEKVREAGGRFLRRHHVTNKGVMWVDIGDEKAREKTCQALREGAPEIRRRKEGSSIKSRGGDGMDSGSSTTDGSLERDKDNCKNSPYIHTAIVHGVASSEGEEKSGSDLSEALVIRPSMVLICKPDHPPITWSVDRLESSEREMYLRDYFPPNPAVQKEGNSGGIQAPSYDYSFGHKNLGSKSGDSNPKDDWPNATIPV